MTTQADESIGFPHPTRVKAWAVRTDIASALRVALHAVLLRVATGAALQSLSCSLPVLQGPEWHGRVVANVAASGRTQSHLQVTTATEHFGVMALLAVGVASPRFRGVPRREVGDMEAPLAFTRVTLGAVASAVTAFAGELAGRRRRTVRAGESRCMNLRLSRFDAGDLLRGRGAKRDAASQHRRFSETVPRLRAGLDQHTSRRPGFCRRDVGDDGRTAIPGMARLTARARMTVGAGGHVAAGKSPM